MKHAPGRGWRCRVRCLALAGVVAGFLVDGAAAQDAPPVLLSAGDIRYEQDSGIVTASGGVEVTAGERILLADRVRYDANTDVVSAEGNVSVLETDGSVFFAERIELSDQLKNGFIRGFRALLSDDSRMAANSVRRVDGNRTEMTRAVYSPCKICDEDMERPPLWRIRASKIVHDQEEQTINYRNARLEFFGIPVAYTPYFSHPDPTVDRKSGFLVPTYGRSTQIGTTIEVQYFLNLAPNRDVTLTPLLTSKEGPVMGGEFRQRTPNGRFQLNGSFTRPDRRNEDNIKTGNKQWRSHIQANGDFDIDETWRWGFSGARSSDDTYLRRYNFNSSDTLTSNLFVEGFGGRSYASANAWAFQGLRAEDDPGQTPLILPMLDYNFISSPDMFGGTFRFDANALSLSRNEGRDSRRLSLRSDWQTPRVGSLGDIWRFSADVRADGYWVSDATNSSRNGFVSRLVPQLAIDWRWPLGRTEAGSRQVVEPLAAFIISPYGGNPSNIPNEDSQNFEFDDTNIFSTNRFPGLDRIEGGPRLNYGVRYGLYANGGGSLTALIGQTLRLRADDTFAPQTGLENARSDFVGRLDLSPSPFLSFYNRFRLDRDALSIRRNEITTTFGTPDYNANITYVTLERELTADELTDGEEINLAGNARLSRYWRATAQTRRDLGDDGGTLNSGIGLVYEDECFNVSINFNRDFTRDRDVQPSSSATLRIRLKHLG